MVMPERYIVFYGNCQVEAMVNCQVEAMVNALGDELVAVGYEPIYLPSWSLPGEIPRELTDDERAACVLLLEQYDRAAQGYPEGLRDHCPTVRFPSLDTNLLWPFNTVNRYNDAPTQRGGGQVNADRVLLRCIDRDWDAEKILTYYLNGYEDFKLNLERVAAMDRLRWESRDAACDIRMTDVLTTYRTVQLFCSSNHPTAALFNILMRRLVRAAADHHPTLLALHRNLTERETFKNGTWGYVPIHPGVADDLDLQWYRRDALYPQRVGPALTHDEYVLAFVTRMIETRRRKRDGESFLHDPVGFAPPLGANLIGIRAEGIYKEGLTAPNAEFEVEATTPIESITLVAYYPPGHQTEGVISFGDGASRATVTVAPGTKFELAVPCALVIGQKAKFSLVCSESLNMFELGLGEDTRDLGVLILAVSGT